MTARGRRHTIEGWLAQPADRRLALIDGEFIEKALPGVPHAMSQGGLLVSIRAPFHRKPGGAGPGAGGWWIRPEIDLQLGANGYRPDVVEAQGSLSVLIADRPQRVRAEPFDSIELHVGALLGDDPE